MRTPLTSTLARKLLAGAVLFGAISSLVDLGPFHPSSASASAAAGELVATTGADVLLHGAPALLAALMLLVILAPDRRGRAREWAERLELNALVDVVKADLMSRMDDACPTCHSSGVTSAPCRLCDDPPLQEDCPLVAA